MQKEEIQPSELCRFIPDLQAAVEAVCESPSFRTSPKSCQFLRHIVFHTLNGDVDELKERLIGITLLGREASYDTGSDAGVRVRANDVRKRLSAYYAANSSALPFTIDIPAGSYIPYFYSSGVFAHKPCDHDLPFAAEQAPAILELPHRFELSLQLLSLPTFVALFLCIICMRWQLAQEDPFDTFWQTVFQDHHALFYVPSSRSSGQRDLVPVNRLEGSSPLFSLAGQFHAGITVTHDLNLPIPPNDILIFVGSGQLPSDNVASHGSALDGVFASQNNRLFIDNTPDGRQIVDRTNRIGGLQHSNIYGHAGLLTIVNGPQRSIEIDGTDEESIASLIKTICERNAFSDELVDSFQQGTITQIIFPDRPHSQAVVFHNAMPATFSAMNGVH
jgi:hypothetical protein